jgi:nitrogen regulatory protein P-II 2
MKLVTAIIKPFKLEDVREALTAMGIEGLTAVEAKGYGQQKGQADIYRGSDFKVTYLPKVKIEVAVTDKQLDDVVKAIQKAAYSGNVGDGKIFVMALERVVRIRTGEEGEKAI